MQAVQFGAGKIGRGFLGQLLFESGYDVTFVDIQSDLVALLDRRREYPLRLVSAQATQTLTIRRCRALDAHFEAERVAQALAEADVVGTSVGVAHLPAVAQALAAGIAARAAAGGGALNILICENQWHAAPLMRDLIRPHLPREAGEYFDTQVGLIETVIGRMVPAPSAEALAEDPLLVVAEPYKELPVARAMLRGPVPPIISLIAADNFDAYEARKLYLSNAGHAALAYLGWRRGHEYLWQCADDGEITAVCAAALAESSQALCAEYRFSPHDLNAFCDDLMRRFANKALGDTVARVAADPIRKLRPTDRLVGAAALCLKHGVVPMALAKVIAAALAYDNPADPSAVILQEQRTQGRDADVLEAVGGIPSGSVLCELVLSDGARMKTGR